MQVLLVILLCLFSSVVLAQTGSKKTVSALTGEVNSAFPSGCTGCINAQTLRQVFLDVVNSYTDPNAGTFTSGDLLVGGPGNIQVQDSAGVNSILITGSHTTVIDASGATASVAFLKSPSSTFTVDNAGNVTGQNFQVTANSNPVNGISLPAANTVGIYANSTEVLSVDSTATVNYTSNLSYAGTATPAWFKEDGHTVSGVSTSASGCCLGLNAFRLYIGSDTIDASTPGTFSEMLVIDAPSAGHKGYRTAITGYVETVGSPGSSSNNNYVGVLGQNRANVNLGGTTFSSYNAGTNQSGSLFGMNANVFAQSGATFMVNVTGIEVDTSIPTGASAAEKHGVTIILSGADAVQGNFDDSALEFDSQDAAGAWKYGISFGAYAHKWSFNTSSTLIVAQTRQVGPASSSVALNGIDFTGVTFSGSPILMPLLTPASSGATCTTGAIEWDTGFIYICTATNTWKRAALATF